MQLMLDIGPLKNRVNAILAENPMPLSIQAIEMDISHVTLGSFFRTDKKIAYKTYNKILSWVVEQEEKKFINQKEKR